MNVDVVKRNLQNLSRFYVKNSKGLKLLTSAEFGKLLSGASYLCLNCSDNVSLESISKQLSLKGVTSKGSFIVQLENKKQTLSNNEVVSYTAITELLNFYLSCIEKYPDGLISSEKWVEISGYLYPLEMERLKSAY